MIVAIEMQIVWSEMSLEYSHTEQIVLHFEGISNISMDWHTWIRQLVTTGKLIK